MPAQQDPDDRYRFGRRQILSQDHTGQPRYRVEPLSPADALNPQPGDEFNVGAQHTADVARLVTCLRTHSRYNPAIAVVAGAILLWPDPDLDRPAPDIVLLNNLPDATRRHPTVDLAAEGASVRAVIEVVAPDFVQQDLIDKPRLYAAAGVPELWIIDSGLRPDQHEVRYSVTGYSLEGGTYRPLHADAQARVHSPSGRFWLAVNAAATEVILGDSRTGQPIVVQPDNDLTTPAAQVEAKLRAESIAAKLDLLG